jgi:hypothetical protein
MNFDAQLPNDRKPNLKGHGIHGMGRTVVARIVACFHQAQKHLPEIG